MISTPSLARFVVGTGRCGSTLLSRMLAQHREVVSLHEVFTGLDWGERFAEGVHQGAAVAEMLAAPNQVMTDVLSRGYRAEEVTYPFRPQDRFSPADPLPWILVSTLPALTEQPDALFDTSMNWLNNRPSASLADHYRALFAFWAGTVQATVWIERSGSSVDYLGELLRLFPEAKILHLFRDGREVALSMREHPFYRLAVQLYYGQIPQGVDPADDSAEGVDRLIRAWLESEPPVELFGRYWSEQLVRGLEATQLLSDTTLQTVAFEDLVEQPAEVIARAADFFELPVDTRFSQTAAALVRGLPPTRFNLLDAESANALNAACAPGFAALERNDLRGN